MAFFVVAIILGIIALIAAVTSVASTYQETKTIGRVVTVVALILGVMSFGASIVRVVPANTVGIPVTFGEIGTPVQSGVNVVAPWTSINELSTRLQVSTFNKQAADGSQPDAVSFRASDEYPVDIDADIRWSIEKSEASTLFEEVGSLGEINDKIVRPLSRQVLRDVGVKFSAEGLYGADRGTYNADVITALKARLATEGIVLDDVNIRDVAVSSALAEAIEAKADANEAAERAIIEQRKEQTQAETRLNVSETDAKAVVTAAQGQADANLILAKSITDELLRLKQIEAYENANTVYVPSDSQVLIGATPGQ